MTEQDARPPLRGALRRLSEGALVGIVSAGCALGVGELVAAFVRPSAAPVIAVGNKFIALTPEPLKNWAIRNFGTNDKTVLLAGIYAVIAVFAVVVGVLAVRAVLLGVAGLILFGAVGVWAAASASTFRGADVVPPVVATLAAVAVMAQLVRLLGVGTQWPLERTERDKPAGGASRRRFLQGSAVAAGLAAVAGFGGRALQTSRFDAAKSRAAVKLPPPASPAPPLPAGVNLTKGAVPFVTPNSAFYRVDIDLQIPQVAAEDWQLDITGLVQHPLRLRYADLLSRPLVERYITMCCVSNEVGGDLVSTAKFLGVRLADLLTEAGVQPAADQIVGRSVDGMTIGTPTAVIMDGRDALLAIGMNDEPLPLAHGFPARTVVPGLYGYVSGTKWITELQATTFAAYQGFWVQRGWVAKAPVRLASRIDVPRPFASVRRGATVPIAGVAWEQHVGIEAVEVQIGDGPWQRARLGRVPSVDTWVQWSLPWTVMERGSVRLRVRAIDRNGRLQTAQPAEPFPAGATGWHTVVVTAV
jgi:DMSO/TMAO reductase YedYZ molybdopterin-dependent catalytic subunit